MKYTTAFLLMLLLFPGCNNTPELSGFNSDQWKNDKNGCEGVREDMVDQLYEVKDELTGLKEKQVIRLLGRPDIAELYKRGQRFFEYNISPGEDCNRETNKDINLVIRFNSLGMANEINIETFQSPSPQ